jgi:hypothetical protein
MTSTVPDSMKRGISQASMKLPELAESCNFETGAVAYKNHLKKMKTFFSLGTTNQFWVRYITPFMADFYELRTMDLEDAKEVQLQFFNKCKAEVQLELSQFALEFKACIPEGEVSGHIEKIDSAFICLLSTYQQFFPDDPARGDIERDILRGMRLKSHYTLRKFRRLFDKQVEEVNVYVDEGEVISESKLWTQFSDCLRKSESEGTHSRTFVAMIDSIDVTESAAKKPSSFEAKCKLLFARDLTQADKITSKGKGGKIDHANAMVEVNDEDAAPADPDCEKCKQFGQAYCIIHGILCKICSERGRCMCNKMMLRHLRDGGTIADAGGKGGKGKGGGGRGTGRYQGGGRGDSVNLAKELKKVRKQNTKLRKTAKAAKDADGADGSDGADLIEMDAEMMEEIMMMEVDNGAREFFDEADEEDEDGSPYTASEKLEATRNMYREEVMEAQLETHRLALEAERVKQDALKALALPAPVESTNSFPSITQESTDAMSRELEAYQAEQQLAYQRMLGKLAEQIDAKKAKYEPAPAPAPTPSIAVPDDHCPWIANDCICMCVHKKHVTPAHIQLHPSTLPSRLPPAPAPAPVPPTPPVNQHTKAEVNEVEIETDRQHAADEEDSDKVIADLNRMRSMINATCGIQGSKQAAEIKRLIIELGPDHVIPLVQKVSQVRERPLRVRLLISMMRDKLATVDGLDISDLDEKFAVFVEDNPDASTIVDSKDELQDFLEGGLVCQTKTFHSRKQAEDWLGHLQVDHVVKYEELEFPSALPVDEDKCVQLGKAIAGDYFVPGAYLPCNGCATCSGTFKTIRDMEIQRKYEIDTSQSAQVAHGLVDEYSPILPAATVKRIQSAKRAPETAEEIMIENAIRESIFNANNKKYNSPVRSYNGNPHGKKKRDGTPDMTCVDNYRPLNPAELITFAGLVSEDRSGSLIEPQHLSFGGTASENPFSELVELDRAEAQEDSGYQSDTTQPPLPESELHQRKKKKKKKKVVDGDVADPSAAAELEDVLNVANDDSSTYYVSISPVIGIFSNTT